MNSSVFERICAGILVALLPVTVCAAPPPELAEALLACTGCHGDDGNGAKRTYPFINWQSPKYLEDQMNGFQAGTQPTNVPKHVPKTISRAQIKALAQYYGAQKPNREKPVHDVAKAVAGKAVFDARCTDCHLDQGRASNQDEPILAGQPVPYLLNQENWYASGKRKYSTKADVAHQGMTDADREAVVHFLASQDVKPAEAPAKKRKRP